MTETDLASQMLWLNQLKAKYTAQNNSHISKYRIAPT
jgi:hypothetical protein